MRRHWWIGLAAIAAFPADADAQVYVRAPFVRVEVGPRGVYVGAAGVRVVAPRVYAPPPPVIISRPIVVPSAPVVVSPPPTVRSAPFVAPQPTPAAPQSEPTYRYESGGEPPPVPVPVPSSIEAAPAPKPIAASRAAPPTPAEFAAGFRPAKGKYDLVLTHPMTGKAVRVRFTLPAGTPEMHVDRRNVEFDYGRETVTLRFLNDGRVRVEYD